jgi:hypothetical protein
VAAGAAGAGAAPRAGAARPSRPPGGPRRSWLALRVAAVTAAVVIVAGGGYGVARLLSGNPGSGTAGSAAVPAPAFGSNGQASRSSAGGLKVPAGQAAAAGGSAPAAPLVSSGTNYQPGQLKAQVSAVLTQYGANTTPGPRAGRTPANQPASSGPRMPACVPHVTGGKRPLLVDKARYQGRPATVIVVSGAIPGTLRALVIAGDCTGTTSHVLATVTLPGSG